MALGVCLLFDRKADRAFRTLWSRLEAQGVSTLYTHTHGRHQPHLSYVVLVDFDVEAVLDALVALPDGGPFELTFDAFAAFRRGRITLVPTVSQRLLTGQRAVVRAVRSSGATVHRHYEIDRWLPHASVATRSTTRELPRVATSVYEVLPLTARVTRAALIDSATGDMWPLPGVP